MYANYSSNHFPMLAHSTLMANSFDLDGGEAAAAFDDSTAEAPPHSPTSLPSSSGSDTAVASDNSENGFTVPVEESIRDDVVRDSYIYESVLSAVSVEESEEEKREGVQVKCSGICAGEIRVTEHAQLQAIDHHAEVFGPSVIGDGKVNGDENGCMRNWTEQEPQKKRAKRRGGKARRNNEVSNCYPTTERREKKGLMYSREELEALRLEKPEEQKKKWLEIYCRLGPEVVEEFDGLARMNMRREKDNTPIFDFDPRPQFQKPTSLGEVSPKVEGDHLENLITSDPSSCPPICDEIGSSVEKEDYCEDDDSEEEYNIQRPAFSVSGEPDFDSGPPLDGLEYLRRVRWEAARIPKVKVVRVNKVKEQSLYMPQIPDVMKCPDNLLPHKEWEDSFLSEFSQLREAFMQLDLKEPSAETPLKEDFFNQMLEGSSTYEKFSISESVDDPFPSEASLHETTRDAKYIPSSPETSNPKAEGPTLSAILKMDSAARTSMLKKRINSVVNMETLPYNDSLWLFALCVAVDCPLLADTSAALRSLLRKCASLRAAKTEVDDEVIVLNILVTITGKYFGQLERES